MTNSLGSKFPGWYTAFATRDPEFDGRVYVGVASTKIFCRTTCWSRLPSPDRCEPFGSAAEAIHAGFRPCLRCRPELAPPRPATDFLDPLVWKMARLLEAESTNVLEPCWLADRVGTSWATVEAAFISEFRVSPEFYRQTCAVLLAKNLLSDTMLSAGKIAEVVGFEDAGALGKAFQAIYRSRMSDFSRPAVPPEDCQDSRGFVRVSLGYRPPFLWEEILGFFGRRAISGVEIIRDGEYRRTAQLSDRSGKQFSGWFKVSNLPANNILQVTVSSSLFPVLAGVLAKVRQMFDLASSPQMVAAGLTSLAEIDGALPILGLRLPGSFDAFEMGVRAILGQRVTVKAAGTLAGRLAATFGEPVNTGIPGLTTIFPSPQRILDLFPAVAGCLGPLGILKTRANAIASLAGLIAEEQLSLSDSPHQDEQTRALLNIRGVGPWTAGYIMIRVGGWQDIFLSSDHGVKTALSSISSEEWFSRSEKWRPWRSYATVNLWNSLSQTRR